MRTKRRWQKYFPLLEAINLASHVVVATAAAAASARTYVVRHVAGLGFIQSGCGQAVVVLEGGGTIFLAI